MKMDYKNHFFNILVVAVCCLIIGLVGCNASRHFKDGMTDTGEMQAEDGKVSACFTRFDAEGYAC